MLFVGGGRAPHERRIERNAVAKGASRSSGKRRVCCVRPRGRPPATKSLEACFEVRNDRAVSRDGRQNGRVPVHGSKLPCSSLEAVVLRTSAASSAMRSQRAPRDRAENAAYLAFAREGD